MATTVPTMDTRLSQMLDDVPFTTNGDGNTWTVANHRMPALNAALRIAVSSILGFADLNEHRIVEKVYDLLSPLQYEKPFSIDIDGYSLIFTDYPMVGENGFIDASVLIRSKVIPCSRYKSNMAPWLYNRYTKGNDMFPVINFKSGKVYLYIDEASYPVTMYFRYIRTPKNLHLTLDTDYNTTLFELRDGMVDLIILGATKLCKLSNTNFEHVQFIDKEYQDLLTKFVAGQIYQRAAGETDVT